MLEELTASEWAEWVAFMKIEPYGDAGTDARLGYALSTLAAMLTGKRITPDRLMPAWDGHEQTWQEMYAMIQRQADAYHRKDQG